MDELEIAGQRYLSTRRAAKEHKYTADYVGQLIRGGKVVGKKVGRSWYVEERSLNAYLNGETVAPEEPVEKKPAPTSEGVVEPTGNVGFEKVEEVKEEVKKEKPVAVPTPEQVEEKNEENVFEPEVIKTKTLEEHHIPIRTTTSVSEKPKGGLRYVIDDEPALPEVRRKSAMTMAPAMPRKPIAEKKEDIAEEEIEIIPDKKIGTLAIVSLVVVGVATLSITALISSTLNSRIVVEQGQVASVGYTFQ